MASWIESQDNRSRLAEKVMKSLYSAVNFNELRLNLTYGNLLSNAPWLCSVIIVEDTG